MDNTVDMWIRRDNKAGERYYLFAKDNFYEEIIREKLKRIGFSFGCIF